MWVAHSGFHFNWTNIDLVMSEKLTFLKSTEPFNLLPEAELERIAKELKEVTFDRRELLYHQNNTNVEGFDIVVKGGYEAFILTTENLKKSKQFVDPHHTYGAFSTLLNKGKSLLTVEVQKNTVVYRMPPSFFKELCKKHNDFYQFFLTAFGKEMLNEQYVGLGANSEMNLEALSFDRYFVRRLDTVSPRPLISCNIHTPCHDAAKMMEEHKLSCLFVEDNGEQLGYITDIILRNKIIGGQMHSATPVKDIMEGPIFRIDSQAFVYEAVLMMFDHMIRYVIVQENGHDIGVVSRTKLLSDQAQSPFVFIQSVRLSLTAPFWK